MASLILAIIYAAFVSLGLPDSLLGAGWPAMRADMGAPLSYAGIVSMIITTGTIASSLSSDRLTRKFGAGPVTAASVALTAAALFGFSVSRSFWMLCVLALPYGLGAGAVDAALNNYVALKYSSRHMNWLHCSWGVGAAISPFIMSGSLTSGSGWAGGYRAVSLIQIALSAALFLTLPLWRGAARQDIAETPANALELSGILKIRGVKYVIAAFFAYGAMELTVWLWASSYLVTARGVDYETAAKYASLFFIGITAGRFLCGFVSEKIGDKNMIRTGAGVLLVGVAALWLPVPSNFICLNGLVVIGLGCAPVYPSIIHATPANFGKENSQAIVGVQMAGAYMGSTVIPPLFGFLANQFGVWLFPPFILAFIALVTAMTEMMNRAAGKGR